MSVTQQICAGCGEGALSFGINCCQQTFWIAGYPVVPASPVLPREQRGWRGAGTGNGWAWMSPAWGCWAWLPQWVWRGMGFCPHPKPRSEAASGFGGSVLLRDSSCQAGGEQQLGEPHLIADAAEQLPHLPSIPRPFFSDP